MQHAFEYRGVVEGYYGRPYTLAERLWLVEQMAAWQMNVYVHAPKDDRFGREEWRTPYPAETMAGFHELVAAGDAAGVRVGFAISPGLSMQYASADDVAALVAKLDAFLAIGARFLCLALDDVPTRLRHEADLARYRSLGEAHAELAATLCEHTTEDVTLWLVPTDYAGTASSAYLETLGAELPARVEVGWTGRSVVSPEITRAEAAARAGALRRRLLVWDNYPVNDGPMRTSLHLGPYTGRDPRLAEHVSGLLLNPMELPRASTVALRTAAEYMRDPEAYAPEEAWQRAVHATGAGAGEAFALLAAAHRFSPLAPDDRDRELESAFVAVRAALEDGEAAASDDALARLQLLLARRARATDTLRSAAADAVLLEEIEPWLLSHAAETEAMRAAADLLEVTVGGAGGLAVALAFFRMEGRLSRLQAHRHASFGPRRAVYPQLESLDDEDAHFGRDRVLFLDHCLAEEIVRFAEARAVALLSREPRER